MNDIIGCFEDRKTTLRLLNGTIAGSNKASISLCHSTKNRGLGTSKDKTTKISSQVKVENSDVLFILLPTLGFFEVCIIADSYVLFYLRL